MIAGIISAVLATALWISAQLLIMRLKPSERRFRAMLRGYLSSLPLVAVCYLLLQPHFPLLSSPAEPVWMGWFHAYLLHLLLFFQYVHFFYHVERSVTVRMLVEILDSPGGAVSHDEINSRYSLDEMIVRRLDVMVENGFLLKRDGAYHNTAKGDLFARLVVLVSRTFRSVTQKDR